MILVDTTVWIDFFTGKQKPQVDTLEVLISEGEDICICGLVLTEVLQGVKSEKQYKKIKDYFKNLIFLPMTQPMHIHSAEIYRSLRKKGITIRKPIDCMIASIAIAHSIPLLHNDKDFNPIEKYCRLKVVKG
jgi:predicted nucleic acid-binding protein